MTKEDYAAYLRSEWWREFSRYIRETRKICERCAFPYELNVHHKTYARIGNELDSDLILLCRSCHAREHFLQDVGKDPFDIYGNLYGLTVDILKRRIAEQTLKAREKNIEFYDRPKDLDDEDDEYD